MLSRGRLRACRHNLEKKTDPGPDVFQSGVTLHVSHPVTPGVYECIATNDHGRDTHSVVVISKSKCVIVSTAEIFKNLISAVIGICELFFVSRLTSWLNITAISSSKANSLARSSSLSTIVHNVNYIMLALKKHASRKKLFQ